MRIFGIQDLLYFKAGFGILKQFRGAGVRVRVCNLGGGVRVGFGNGSKHYRMPKLTIDTTGLKLGPGLKTLSYLCDR